MAGRATGSLLRTCTCPSWRQGAWWKRSVKVPRRLGMGGGSCPSFWQELRRKGRCALSEEQSEADLRRPSLPVGLVPPDCNLDTCRSRVVCTKREKGTSEPSGSSSALETRKIANDINCVSHRQHMPQLLQKMSQVATKPIPSIFHELLSGFFVVIRTFALIPP